MSEVVSYNREGNIGVITVNYPPVNALGQAVRSPVCSQPWSKARKIPRPRRCYWFAKGARLSPVPISVSLASRCRSPRCRHW